MLSYRDMTFCPFYKQCRMDANCYMALTEDVEAGARKADMLICQFTDKPECFKEKQDDRTERQEDAGCNG